MSASDVEYLMRYHEPAEQTRVSFQWQGHEQWGAIYGGSPASAIRKAMRDLESRARCGALAKGSWEVVARGERRGIEVD